MNLEINKIYNGDCLELMKDIPDKSIDMILCDLPYGTTACKWDSIIPFEPLWEQYKRVIKDNGAIVLTASQPFTSALVMSNPKWFKCEWIWDKVVGGNFVQAKRHPLKTHESVLVFGNKSITYNPQMTDADLSKNKPLKRGLNANILNIASGDIKYSKDRDDSKRYPVTIQRYHSKEKECNSVNRIHPTQKPVSLFEYLIKTYSNEGETVLDNCIGSGTTAIACINTNRKYIGFELNSDYYNKAIERVELHKKEIE